jgi:hypothetical protein
VADFYITECHIPVDVVPPSGVRWTALEALVTNNEQDEITLILPMAKWLIEKKGASVTHTELMDNDPVSLALIVEVFEYLIERKKMEHEA